MALGATPSAGVLVSADRDTWPVVGTDCSNIFAKGLELGAIFLQDAVFATLLTSTPWVFPQWFRDDGVRSLVLTESKRARLSYAREWERAPAKSLAKSCMLLTDELSSDNLEVRARKGRVFEN